MYPHKGAFSSMGGCPPTAINNMAMVGETQWMSQNAYQNIDLDKVDWAQLAQQWIHMKESCGVSADESQIQIEAPPPPRISQSIPEYEEKGEAPMEVEHDDEPLGNVTVAAMTAPPAPTNIFQTNNWNSESSNSRSQSHQQQQQKPWNRKGNRWNATNSNHSKSQRNSSDAFVSGQIYGNAKQQQQQHPPPMPVWSSGSTSVMAANAPPPPPSFVNSNANHHPSDLRLQGLDANQKSGIQLEQVGNVTATPPLDAAQRKTLPAWIREGLEKMEREKQRQAERDREMKERDEKRRQEKLIEQNLLMQLNANESSPKLPAKSKFESDSESDNDDTVNSDYSENMPMARVMAAERAATVGNSSTTMANASASNPSVSSTPVPTFKPHRTKAEILTEIMLSVRKNLTEILLEVTNEEIYAIAQDTLSKVRTKGRKAQSVQKNALTAITPALGLVGYYDSDASKSDDGSDTDDEQDTEQQRTSDVDSESELMKTIQRRKAAFENKSIEIESYLAETEEKEKQWLEQDDSVKAEESDSPDDSPAPPSSNQTRAIEHDETQRDMPKVPGVSKTERKGSRFSDAKALVYNVANSQLVNTVQPPPAIRQNSLEHRPPAVEPKALKSSRRDDHSDDSDSSRKRSKYSSSSSRSSHHRGKHDHYHNHSPSSRHHKKSSRRRSSSSSSDRSSYSRHSDRSKHSDRSRKHSRRERSSSRSSQGSSHKRDKHSHERSYSRSHSSYKQSRH